MAEQLIPAHGEQVRIARHGRPESGSQGEAVAPRREVSQERRAAHGVEDRRHGWQAGPDTEEGCLNQRHSKGGSVTRSRDAFEHRHIDYDGNEASCTVGEFNGFRAYRTTRNGRLSPRGQQVLIVCMACRRSMYEWHGAAFDSWWFNHNIGIHAQDCDQRL